jgi:4-hydroxybenzoate polyprenyltransferase
MTRPMNLIIIAVTMVCIHVISNPWISIVTDIRFLLRVISAISIAAAGNIINDYFDRKVDLINKPERTYVDVSVKRRVAIMIHLLLNMIGLATGVMGCLTAHWLWLLCPLTTIFILWWYSPVLKKKFLWGNMAVSICTAAVPLWAVCGKLHEGVLIAIVFAFITTLLREIIKDIEDTKGDKTAGYDTLAVRWGIRNTKVILNVISGVIIGLFVFLTIFSERLTEQIFFTVMVGSMVLLTIQIHRSKEPRHFSIPSRTLKWIMLAGVILLPWVYGKTH